jgi:ABC-type proline/glycine betaine transport system substrate-binding protein
MERRFDMTNFEQSLKDHADQFYIVPSRKVWHGIYNDLHPGSKWPSIAMGLFFLFILIGIGHLNNIPKRTAELAKIERVETQVSSENEVTSAKLTPPIITNKKKNQPLASAGSTVDNVNPNTGAATAATNNSISTHSSIVTGKTTASNFNKGNDIKNVISGSELSYSGDRKILTNNVSSKNNSGDFSKVSNEKFYSSGEIASNDYTTSIIENRILLPKEIFFFNNNVLSTSAPLINNSVKQKEIIIENNESAHSQNTTAHIRKKKNGKVNWFYYVTPTITSVYFTGKAIQKAPPPNFSSIVIRPNQPGNNMIYNARLGFETGTEMIYTFAKNWSFITGAHVSYSGYNIISDQVHPTFASLILKNESGATYSKSYITHYGNGQGQNQITLKNYNLQLSAPVGLQYVLWGNKNLQINLASTIEPSFVLKSNAYLLSSDGRNYVNDPDLMRKINLSGNFGSYVTFSSNKLKWRVGPSVRYQVLSTYQNIYPVKEHLIDYGIRIGISK